MAKRPDGQRIERNLQQLSVTVLLGAIIFVVVGDRIGPHLFERWGMISDFGLLAILAALVSLVLGYGVGFFKRNGDGSS